MNQPHSVRMIAFRGTQLPVTEVGSGPPLGYLHGIVGNPVVPALVQALAVGGHRVISPNLPGFSGAEPCEGLRTMHDWVAALSEIVDGAGLAGQTVVACSIGAMLALELAAVRPEAFARLILVAPLGLWDDADPVADLFANTVAEERKLLTSDIACTAAFYDDKHITDPALLVQRTVDRFVTRTTAASLVWPLPEFGLASRIHRVRCPVNLVWGAQDHLVPPSYLERFRKLLPRVEATHILPDAGHLADWDQPQEVSALVETWLRAPRPTSGSLSA
jgi:pimeloyl-ACP methyl ester carboxylesterase